MVDPPWSHHVAVPPSRLPESGVIVQIVLFDLVQQRLVADLEQFGRPLPIPMGLVEDAADQIPFGLTGRLLPNALERVAGRRRGRQRTDVRRFGDRTIRGRYKAL